MLLELLPVLALPMLLVLAAWGLVRRRRPRTGGPLTGIPDAPPSAKRAEAPGLTPPYSSLDPWAPPKQPLDWSRPDRPSSPD